MRGERNRQAVERAPQVLSIDPGVVGGAACGQKDVFHLTLADGPRHVTHVLGLSIEQAFQHLGLLKDLFAQSHTSLPYGCLITGH